MKRNPPPAGREEARGQRLLEHYERQTEDEAVAEDEAAYHSRDETVMAVPKRLVPVITRWIEGRHRG